MIHPRHQHHAGHRSTRVAHQRGLTLLELAIASVIVALLMLLSLPATSTYSQRPRRMDGISALLNVQQVQERYRSNHASYAASLTALGLPGTSSAHHYQLSTSTSTDTADHSYRIGATAQGAQLADSGCLYLALIVTEGRTTQSSGATAALANDNNANKACWRE